MSNYYLNFSGTGKITVPSDASFNFGSGNFSLSSWIRTSSNGTILYNDAAMNSGDSIFYIQTGLIKFLGSMTLNDFTLNSDSTIIDGEWHHIVITVDRASNGLIYIDNVLDSTTDISTETGNLIQGALVIGSNRVGYGYGDYTGDIDDIRIYKGIVLTPAQINDIYNVGIGTKVNETDFATITQNGWYSNADNSPDNYLAGRKITAGAWDNLDSYSELGPELVENGDFEDWAADDPVGWDVLGESGNDPEISEAATGESHVDTPTLGGGMCNIYSSEASVSIEQTILTIGKTYRVTVTIDTVVDGGIYISGFTSGHDWPTIGTKVFSDQATSTVFSIRRRNADGDDATIDNVSVKEIILTSDELVENGDFEDWADSTVPDGWEKVGTHNGTNFVEESPADSLRVVSDGTDMSIRQTNMMTIGLTYLIVVDIQSIALGGVRITGGFSIYATLSTPGIHHIQVEADRLHLIIQRDSACDVTINSISVKEVGVFTATWSSGGFPIPPDNISTTNLAGMKIGVATSQITNDTTFDSLATLMTSYIDNSIVKPQPSYSPNLNIGGVPLSVSLCYDPTLDSTTGDTVGFFHALDVLETFEDAEIESNDKTIVPATSATFGGNRLQVSRISNNYYLNTVRLGETSAPINPITLQGISMATGNNNELILRKDASEFHIDDIGTNPETGKLDIKLVNIGGTPLSAGRIGNKYYLIVKPVANP